MFVMVAGRQLGKTTLLVNWWLEAPEYRGILTFDEKSRSHVIRHIRDAVLGRGADPKRFLEIANRNVLSVTWMVSRGIRALDIRQWAIDDLDRVLPVLLGGENVELITATATLIPNFGSHKATVNGDVVHDNGQELPQRRALPTGYGSGSDSSHGGTSFAVGTASYPRP